MTVDSSEREASDEELARRAQAGCTTSLETLIKRFQVPLVHFLLHRTNSRADAEDLCQETMLRAYENLARYQPALRFSTWLFTIGRRLAINHRRALRPTIDAEQLSETPATGREPVDEAAHAEDRQRLWGEAARLLSEEQFSTLWFHYVEAMETAEIAQVLGRSRVAVKAILFRARRKLMPSFAKMFGVNAVCPPSATSNSEELMHVFEP